MFGGLGFNPFNPALVGRTVLQAAFPVAMTSWTPGVHRGPLHSLPSSTLTLPFTEPVYDGSHRRHAAGAVEVRPRADRGADLALGFTGGSAGETSSVLILLGGLYLVAAT